MSHYFPQRVWAIAFICSLVCIHASSEQTFATDGVTEEAKLLWSGGAEDDRFGTSVDICGDVAVVGMYGADHDQQSVGGAVVYRHDLDGSGNWVEEATLFASDENQDEYFGCSVSVDGDLIVVGSYLDGELGNHAGAAYVFRYDPDSGRWDEEIKLLAASGEAGDYFGYSVAIDNDVIVIGAYGDNRLEDGSGSAYVFRYEPDGAVGWVEEARLIPWDHPWGDSFGWSVSIHQETIIVGMNNGSANTTASVFRYNPAGSGQWEEEAWFTATGDYWYDIFGDSVSIDDDLIVIGAPGDDDMGFMSGSAYVHRYNGTDWVLDANLFASDGQPYDQFGDSVVVNGDTIIIGAPFDSDNRYEAGSVYIFRYDPTGSGQWIEDQKLLASDSGIWDMFGISIALEGDTVFIGAEWDKDNGVGSGSAYMFVDRTTDLSMLLNPKPLRAGENAVFRVSGCEPNEKVYMFYSLVGVGSTRHISLQGTVIDLSQAIWITPGNTAKEDGVVIWRKEMPSNSAGWDIWFQAIQIGKDKSNIIRTYIE